MLFRKLQFTDGLTNLKRGYVGFENKHSPGRPVEATAQEKIHQLLKTDRKSYLNEISEGYNKQKCRVLTNSKTAYFAGKGAITPVIHVPLFVQTWKSFT